MRKIFALLFALLFVLSTSIIMTSCEDDGDDEDTITMADLTGTYYEQDNIYSPYVYAVFDDGFVKEYIHNISGDQSYVPTDVGDYEINNKTLTIYRILDTLEFEIRKTDGEYELYVDYSEFGVEAEIVYKRVDTSFDRGVSLSDADVIGSWAVTDFMNHWTMDFNEDKTASFRSTRITQQNSTNTYDGTWELMPGDAGVVMTSGAAYFYIWASGTDDNPGLQLMSGRLYDMVLDYGKIYAGTYQTEEMGGMSSYMQLWDDRSGEIGDVITGFGAERSSVVAWEVSNGILSIEYSFDYPFSSNMITSTYTISKNGDVITLIDTEDPDYVYTPTSALTIDRVIMSANQILGSWSASSGDGISFNSDGTATEGSGSSTWEFAASPHVVYIIDSENYYRELTGFMDGITLKLKDLDNTITYTHQ